MDELVAPITTGSIAGVLTRVTMATGSPLVQQERAFVGIRDGRGPLQPVVTHFSLFINYPLIYYFRYFKNNPRHN